MVARANGRSRLRLLWSLVLLLGVAGGAAGAQNAAAMSDDQFIESLGRENAGPVDRKRLARLFFSIAATLDGGKSSVRLLQSTVGVPESSRQAVRGLLARRYDAYEDALGRFKRGATELLDEPDSQLLLYRGLVDGERACWQFDLYYRLVETYGSSAQDLLSSLSSREACNRLRTAIFRPPVEGIIHDALVDLIYTRQEVGELREQVADLEVLVDDLMRIDEAE